MGLRSQVTHRLASRIFASVRHAPPPTTLTMWASKAVHNNHITTRLQSAIELIAVVQGRTVDRDVGSQGDDSRHQAAGNIDGPAQGASWSQIPGFRNYDAGIPD